MKSFTRTVSMMIPIILLTFAHLVQGCAKGKPDIASTNATVHRIAALTQDCRDLAKKFHDYWDSSTTPLVIAYTHDTGLTTVDASGTCQFEIKVAPFSSWVYITYLEMANILDTAINQYRGLIYGMDVVGVVGNYNCPEDDFSQMTWYVANVALGEYW